MATTITPIQKLVVFERPGVEAVRLSITAGNSVPTHASNVDVAAVVVKGFGRFILEGKPVELHPGSVVDMHPNQQHSVEAKTDLELVVLHYRLGSANAAVHCGA
ncbi:MAG: cupin domain-containing protein [Terriglobales bacterium]